MFNFIRKKGFWVTSIVTSFFILSSLASPAYAWKLKTHAYIANIVIDDAKDGKVWIPPYGEFEVRPEIAEAMTKYPEFFRGGSIGPDGFPDFWTGQSKIHPDTNPWLILLWNSLKIFNAEANTKIAQFRQAGGIMKGLADALDKARLQIWAFTFGYFSHASGDMWAHDWVNVYAGKAFPGLTEIKADPTTNLPVVTKHIAIENTLDKRITLSANTIDIPNDYVINTMILNRQAISLGMNPVVSYFASKYFDKLPYKDQKVTVAGVATPAKTYDAMWFDDLDRGFKSTDALNPGWMEANKRAIKDVMEKNKGMIGSLGEYLGMWAVTYFFDMLGFPSVTTWVGAQIAGNKADIEWAFNKIGLGEDQRSQITSDTVNVLLILSLGMDKTTFDRIWTTEMTKDLFPAATFDEIMTDMGTPPAESLWNQAWTNQSVFNSLITTINGPLYNSVITTKIAILKPEELKRLVGKQIPGVTGEVAILGVLKGIDFSKQFASGNGLGGDWLGYGMNLSELQNANWRPIFPVVFKPYGPRDSARQEVWSSSLDANHRWAGIYPVTPQMLIKPPTISNIEISQFNPETIEVEFKGDRQIASAALDYQMPGSSSVKSTSWLSGLSLQPAPGFKYTISIHEAGMPAGTYKIKVKVKDAGNLEAQTGFIDFVLFGSSSDWGFKATPGANNTYVLTWNKYPRAGEFQKYVLGKGDQLPPTSTTAHATSYDADQIKRPATAQPVEIANINTTTKTISSSQLTNLTLTARSKRGNFLTKPIAPTVIQPQATTSTSTTTATSTTATTSTTSTGTTSHTTTGAKGKQKYQ